MAYLPGNFRQRLQELIEKHDVKRDQLAALMGVHKSTLSRILGDSKEKDDESPKVSVDSIVKVAKYFNVSTDFLLGILRDIRTKVIHRCLDAMGPRERKFAIYRYGFCDVAPMGRESISKYFNLPMHEVLRLEACVKQYILESLDVDDALEFFGKESIDPAEIAARAQEAYENLFSEPAADYLTNLVDAFQTTWESEEHILLCT